MQPKTTTPVQPTTQPVVASPEKSKARIIHWTLHIISVLVILTLATLYVLELSKTSEQIAPEEQESEASAIDSELESSDESQDAAAEEIAEQRALTALIGQLRKCDAGLPQQMQAQPNVDAISQLMGLGDVFANGYEIEHVCFDENTELVAFMLSKRDSSEVCEGLCDDVVFATYDSKERTLNYIESEQKLGFYAQDSEAFCFIDTISVLDADTELLFYCGNQVGEGFGSWYKYAFSTDDLTEVQRLTSPDPETFEVFYPEILEEFHYKSNAEIQLK